MEIRIKTGEALTCEYTGAEHDVLVKLGPDDGATETKWIGIAALMQAARVIGSISKECQPQIPQQPAAPVASAPQQMPGQVIHGASPLKDPPEAKDQFEKDLTRFVDKESEEDSSAEVKPGEERPSYLPEMKLKEYVRSKARTFRNPVAVMLPALAKHVGMGKDRLEHILRTES